MKLKNRQVMIKKEKDSLVWFEFEQFQEFPFLRHAVFSRSGGVSSGSFSSLNLNKSDLDPLECRLENHKRAMQAISSEKDIPVVSGNQVHRDSIYLVHKKPNIPIEIPDCDALITQIPNIALKITHADCQAAIFFDPLKRVVAIVHAGWRGNVQNIYMKTTTVLESQFGCKSKDLLVSISPSLGPDSSQFLNYQTELPESFWPFQVRPYYFDLWKISQWQLEEAGILPHHIEIAKICTYSNPDHFFSYRREKPNGCNATFAWLEDTK